ncbi:MAG TPA: biosynthetic-type acetolactate synthase large subunit [Clostridiales bacterium]|jgi:acetolactate synthase-1/2/3 large subunit|nr:biosynthetic-type acetolactate synthase large subunit [Clostridiales bacterium]
MKLNGSQILMETLIEQGVDTIFGYPGGAVLNIYDALYDYSDRIKHILTAHEQGAAHAADGYARSTGRPGVVLATSGPGATNLVTGIATAYMDSIPMIALTGNVSTNLLGKDSFQEIYITGITMPITKHNYVVRDVEDLADTIREAFRIATSGRPGPVLIDLPKDITAAICEHEAASPVNVTDEMEAIPAEDLQTIADVLNESQRPVILFGGGVVASGASAELAQLIRKMDCPSCHTVMATGVMPADDPYNLGLIGMHGTVSSSVAVHRADVLLAIGSRFSDRVATNASKFARNQKIIHIDIDAAEINKNVPIDHSYVGDVKAVLKTMLPLIEKKSRSDWNHEISVIRERGEYRSINCEGELKPNQIIQDIYRIMGPDIAMTTDVGQHQMWAAQYSQATDPRRFLTSGGLGTMGFGYGAAIGAAMARPGETIVHITGDGSFHMNLQELCTAVSHQLPIITIIFNNMVLGMVYQWQRIFYNNRFSFTEPNRQTDFVKLAEAFGAHGRRCRTPEEFQDAITEAKRLQGPVVIELVMRADERVLPMIPAGLTIDEVILD